MELILATGAADIRSRVDGATIFEDFKMNMGTSRTTGTTHFGDNFALFDNSTHLGNVFQIMSITGDVTIAVIELDPQTIACARQKR